MLTSKWLQSCKKQDSEEARLMGCTAPLDTRLAAQRAQTGVHLQQALPEITRRAVRAGLQQCSWPCRARTRPACSCKCPLLERLLCTCHCRVRRHHYSCCCARYYDVDPALKCASQRASYNAWYHTQRHKAGLHYLLVCIWPYSSPRHSTMWLRP